MIKNSAKTNLLFENFTMDAAFDLDLAYPSEEDFTFVKKAKAEYANKGYNAEAHYRPDVLAIVMTNKNRIIRILVASILLGWNDMVQAMKAAFERLGGSNNELKGIINEIITNRSKISGFNSDDAKDGEPEETQPQQQTTSTTGQSANAGVTNMGVTKNFCRLIVYDTSYNPPARRHIYVGKKVGNIYTISVGGSQFGPSHSWYDEPLFDSLQQALNFIHNVNQTNIKTVVDTRNFKYNITDKPIDLGTYQGTKIQIADLSDAVLVDTACGPAYIQRKNKKCMESLQEKIVHLDNGDWQVQSEKGRNMGTYDTKKEAEKRLGQVEYFKHINEEIDKDLETKVRNIIKDFSDENNSRLSILEYDDGYDGFKEKFDNKEIDFGVFTLNKLSDKEIEDGKPVITFLLTGGLNGSGKWEDYLNDTSDLFTRFKEELGLNAIVYKINTDIPDDIWTAEILLYASPKEEVKEDVEKHKHLNPKLFDNNHLKPEVRQKCMEIVDFFLKQLEEDEVKIDVKDIIFTGSNASYNYTKDSDIDLHIIADTSNFECPDNLYPKLYNAYKSLFNSKFDVSFYGIPVEIYVETGDTPLISNGIYSIKNDAWVQEPTETTIPEIDWNDFMKVYDRLKEELDCKIRINEVFLNFYSIFLIFSIFFIIF